MTSWYPGTTLGSHQDTLPWVVSEMQETFFQLPRKKLTLAQDCGAREMKLQQRDQKVEEEPGRCWSPGRLNQREQAGGR